MYKGHFEMKFDNPGYSNPHFFGFFVLFKRIDKAQIIEKVLNFYQ